MKMFYALAACSRATLVVVCLLPKAGGACGVSALKRRASAAHTGLSLSQPFTLAAATPATASPGGRPP